VSRAATDIVVEMRGRSQTHGAAARSAGGAVESHRSREHRIARETQTRI
jgi:hypothetical protein